MINLKRVRKLNSYEQKPGPIVYWMSRDQRVNDNWALIFASELSLKYSIPLIVVFNVVPQFGYAGFRQYHFMLEGLKQVEKKLTDLNIQFKVLVGNASKNIVTFINDFQVGALVSDFDPMKLKKQWKSEILKSIQIPFYEVDAHNIVPCWIASEKQEYAAYTFRQKVNKFMKSFLDNFSPIEKRRAYVVNDNDWEAIYKKIKVAESIKPVDWAKPGEDEALKVMEHFIKSKLQFYHLKKNDPNKDVTSKLSPYIHFGQISAQRIAQEVINSYNLKEAKDAFIEELFVRRELSDNFCHYNQDYDSVECFPDWAKKTLEEHLDDERKYNYSLEELENAKTHNNLWNAAQMQMVKTGRMHGYMRMYWAKKILEWVPNPSVALEYAIYLNDKYQLDGRDPNGYVGIAWSIGGVHDRAWQERPISGKIRYMGYYGCKAKFDVDEYINKWLDY